MDRVTVTLRVSSAIIPPDQMTLLLDTAPDSTSLKGADRSPSRPFPKAHGWFMYIAEEGEPIGEEVLLRVLDKAEGILPNLDKLRSADPAVEVEISVALTCTSKPVLNFAAQTIARLSRFGGSFDIDFFEPEQSLSWPGSQDWWEG